MKYQIATTPEQSARLIACGVDEATADIVYTTWDNDGETLTQLSVMSEYAYEMDCLNPTPAWSLSALLAMLPKEIYDNSDDMYYFSLAKDMAFTDEYSAAYIPCWSEGDDLIYKRDNCPIEACTQMIEWLTKNNYRLNKI